MRNYTDLSVGVPTAHATSVFPKVPEHLILMIVGSTSEETPKCHLNGSSVNY